MKTMYTPGLWRRRRKSNFTLILGIITVLALGIALILLVWYEEGTKSQPAPKNTPTAQEMPKTGTVAGDGSEFCGLKEFICPGEDAEPVSTAIETRWRTVTAYNVGDPNQNDSTPCIGATGKDLCKLLQDGVRPLATNELPLYTRVKIDGVVYEVLDRTNSRYQYRYDIAFPLDQKQEALAFGSKTLAIEILN